MTIVIQGYANFFLECHIDTQGTRIENDHGQHHLYVI